MDESEEYFWSPQGGHVFVVVSVRKSVNSCHRKSMCARSQRIRLMCFHLPVCHFLFLQKPKPPQVTIETFLRMCCLFVCLLVCF